MSKLFETTTIASMTLENRFIRSATAEALAGDDGSASSRLTDMYVRLARGGVGLIITGHAYVSREGAAGPRQLGVHSDRLVGGLASMVNAVHEAGGKIVLQLAHAGCRAASAPTGLEPLAPSAMEGEKGPLCRAMTRGEIIGVVEAFAHAATRAGKAGFDGVQIHAAHGYLLSQFLSPFHNKREDGYGGDLENRARIVLEVVRAVRDAMGPRRALLIKLNSEDFVEGGFSVGDLLELAPLIEKAGVDAVEMSGGSPFSPKYVSYRPGPIKGEKDEVYYREAACRYKEQARVPLMLVGGIRSYEVAKRLVEEGTADYISLCRPLIREPDLISRWRSGDTRTSTCLSDNLCFKPLHAGEGLYCVVERRVAGPKVI
jgi:2,4-dienoyl-CoA reductase-like NADH-dependent reductase (Old Yellow Enzyme family)